MAKYSSKRECELCDAIRTIFNFIKNCLEQEDKVKIKVAKSVNVEPVVITKPK